MRSLKFKDRFPRLYRLEMYQGCSIQDRWDNDMWYWAWQRPVHGGTEVDQFSDLIAAYSDFVPGPGADHWWWALYKSHDFYVYTTQCHIDDVCLEASNNSTR